MRLPVYLLWNNLNCAFTVNQAGSDDANISIDLLTRPEVPGVNKHNSGGVFSWRSVWLSYSH